MCVGALACLWVYGGPQYSYRTVYYNNKLVSAYKTVLASKNVENNAWGPNATARLIII